MTLNFYYETYFGGHIESVVDHVVRLPKTNRSEWTHDLILEVSVARVKVMDEQLTVSFSYRWYCLAICAVM